MTKIPRGKYDGKRVGGPPAGNPGWRRVRSALRRQPRRRPSILQVNDAAPRRVGHSVGAASCIKLVKK